MHVCNNGIAKRCPFSFLERVWENSRKTRTINIFYVFLLNWKKEGDIFLARIALAFHLKQICLGKQRGQKGDGDPEQCYCMGWFWAASGNVSGSAPKLRWGAWNLAKLGSAESGKRKIRGKIVLNCLKLSPISAELKLPACQLEGKKEAFCKWLGVTCGGWKWDCLV